MVSYTYYKHFKLKNYGVLILFVMDNGLVQIKTMSQITVGKVLILFVMDNGLVLDHIRLY